MTDLATAAADGVWEKDEFSDSSWKLALLLQLRPGACVAISGQRGLGWIKTLNERGFRTIVAAPGRNLQQAAGTCDAVLHFADGTSGPKFSSLLELLNDHGQFFGLFRHRLSLLRGARASLRSLLAGDAVFEAGCTRQLRKARMSRFGFWIPLPSFDGFEEFACAKSGDEIALSLGAGRLRSSLFRHGSDGLGVYATKSSVRGTDILLERLTEGLAGVIQRPPDLRILRFDLRVRGALVLIMRADSIGLDFVCRLGCGRAVGERLQRHWDMQSQVRTDSLRAASVAMRIPHPVVQFDLGEYRCWIEERAAGTVSWRLSGDSRIRLAEELLQFLTGLGRLGSQARIAGAEEVRSRMLAWSDEGRAMPASLRDTLDESRRYLGGALRTESFKFGWTHGDFGYGNAIASAADGALRAVIDWETASQDSPLGVDLFNFLIQRRLSDNSGDLVKSVASVIESIGGPELDQQLRGADLYAAEFLPRPRQRFLCFGLALYRWIQRESRQQDSSPWSHEHLRAAMVRYLAETSNWALESEVGPAS